MKDVLIISNYWHFESEKSSSRYLTIANMVADAGMDVELITSTFYHTKKRHRKFEPHRLKGSKYRTTLLHEVGYRKNISIARVFSHKTFARNVAEYLKQRKKPDVIYLFVPPLDLGSVVTKYANEHGVKIVIDVLDLWPEAYKMILKTPGVSNMLFAPLAYRANQIYRRADEIVAVSQTYVERAVKCNTKCAQGHCVFIGADLSQFDAHADENPIPREDSSEIRFAYIGMLGHSYDIKVVIDALAMVAKQGIAHAKFIVMGDGPLKEEFESYAQGRSVAVEFTGRLPYGEMVQRLKSCDVAVNPLVKGAAQSIINKHADYFASGLPILNTQENPEFCSLVEEYHAGMTSAAGDAFALAENIELMCRDQELRLQMGRNSRRLAEEKFDRKVSYTKILELIQV